MWDYTAGGTVDPKWGDVADFGGRQLLDGVSTYMIGFFFRQTRTITSNYCSLFSEKDWFVMWGVGVEVRIHPSTLDKIRVVHDGVSATLSPAIALDTTYSYLIVWNSTSGLVIYRDGSSWHTDGAFTTVPTVPSYARTAIGAPVDSYYYAPPGQLGNVAVWPNVNATGKDAEMWHAGIMPHRGSVRFFHRCKEVPGKDEYARQIPDCYRYEAYAQVGPHKLAVHFFDDVSLYKDPSDEYFELHGETPHEQMQVLAGEELHRRRLVQKRYQITVPTQFLAEELMEDLQLTHQGGLECTGEGFGYGDAPERLARIEGMALDPKTRNVHLGLRDIKRYAVSYYNSFRAPFTITGRQLGVDQLFPPYAAKTTSRDTYAWGQDVEGVYQEFGLDQEPVTYKGLLVESYCQNFFQNAAFKHQHTNWVTYTEGSATCTAEAPSVKAFDESITQYATKMVCPAGDTAHVEQTVTGPGAGTEIKLSVIYYAPDRFLTMRVERQSDGLCLQSLTTGGWGAGTWLGVPRGTSYKEVVRYVVPYVFDGNDTYEVRFIGYNPSGDDKTWWVYHAQFENGKFATSPVVNETGNGIVRHGTVTTLRNPDGLLLPTSGATIAFEFEPLWANDESSANKNIMRLRYNATERVGLYWQHSTTRFVCDWYFNTTSQASIIDDQTWSAGDTLKIAVRWLSPGDLGKDAAQGQLFMKFGSGAWVEGPVAEFTQSFPSDVESILYVGSFDGTIGYDTIADGYIRYLHCFPEALPFEEIQAITEAWR